MLVFTVTGEVASACPEGLQTPILSRASRSLLRQVVYYMFRTIYWSTVLRRPPSLARRPAPPRRYQARRPAPPRIQTGFYGRSTDLRPTVSVLLD